MNIHAHDKRGKPPTVTPPPSPQPPPKSAAQR